MKLREDWGTNETPLVARRRTVMGVVILGVVSALGLEVGGRIATNGYIAIYPQVTVNLVQVLPGNSYFKIMLPGLGRTLVRTDLGGARVDEQYPTDRRDPGNVEEVLVVGDSQMLGWGIPFESTSGNLLARMLFGARGRARLLAGPGIDVESARLALDTYLKTLADYAPRICVLSINLGNDLDEMFVGRQRGYRSPPSLLKEWLLQHSTVLNHLTLLYRIMSLPNADSFPPAINPIFYGLTSEERLYLARVVAQEARDVLARIEQCGLRVVLVIPSDVQVDEEQFGKYTVYYNDADRFNFWKSKITKLRSELMMMQQVIVEDLHTHGVLVVSASEAFKEIAAERLFFPDSHHLTTEAHERVANALKRRIVESQHGL